jgi:pimeloyl-ACP methyl ester carboxylesterase
MLPITQTPLDPMEERGLLPTLCRVVNYIRAIIADIVSAIALAILFPVDLERFDPKKPEECDPSQRPILLIHGFLGSSNNWVYHRYCLLQAGYKNIFTVNLGDPRKSIEDYTKIVAAKVETIKALTGRADIVLVGHSMGGLVAQQYRYTEPGADACVKKIITIGTPCFGTHVALAASWASTAAQEMQPNSELVSRLQQAASADQATEYIHIATKADMMVRPVVSALGASGPRSSTRVLNATGHIQHLFSPATAGLLEESLRDVRQDPL